MFHRKHPKPQASEKKNPLPFNFNIADTDSDSDDEDLEAELDEILQLSEDKPRNSHESPSHKKDSSDESIGQKDEDDSDLSLNKFLSPDPKLKQTTSPSPPPARLTSSSNLQMKAPSTHKSGQQIVTDFINKEDPPKPASSSISAANLALLKRRHEEYKHAAISARQSGDLERAKQLMVAVKALDEAIPHIEEGEEPFNAEEDMPPPPDVFAPPSAQPSSPPQQQQQQHPQPSSSGSPGSGTLAAAAASPVVSKESLTARVTILQMMLKNAEASNNPMAGMLKRTLGYYTEALTAFNKGIAYDYTELTPVPNCPRFQPYKPTRAPAAAAAAATTARPQAPAPAQEPSSSASAAPRPAGGPAPTTPSQRVAQLLRARQQELRSAAARAKAEGNMELAKKHLRASLSMNSMVQAAEAGLPVDLSQLPPAPGSAKKGAVGAGAAGAGANVPILSGKQCDPPVTFQTLLLEATAVDSVCSLLKTTLANQADEAEELANSHRQAGVNAMADKLMTLSNISRQCIAYVDAAQKRGRAPDYAFETANLSRLNRNNDLGEDVLEVQVVRGISLPIPSCISGPEALDTYVALELPYPTSESPQRFSTAWARRTNQPTDYGGFEGTARFTINRKARSFERLLHGPKTLKATVYFNRGMLKKAGVLGTVAVKLDGLISSATSTACHDLMDGRTAVGGMLEITLRLRSPLSGPAFHTVTKPWLIIHSSRPKTASAAPRAAAAQHLHPK